LASLIDIKPFLYNFIHIIRIEYTTSCIYTLFDLTKGAKFSAIY